MTLPDRGGFDVARERDLLVHIGEAMTISGESIEGVRDRLSTVARHRGVDDVKVVVFPASIWVQTGSTDATSVQFSSFTNRDLRLDQIAELYEAIDRIASPSVPVEDATDQIVDILRRPAPFGVGVRAIGHGALAAGFSLSLQPSPAGALSALILGTAVGFLISARVPGLRATAPVIAAFAVALLVFGLAEWVEPINPIRALIPPLITFLPGAALATGMRDLATGQTVSGSSRLVQGVVVLLMLGVGIVSAATLVGVPSAQLLDRPVERLGAWAPWAGLVLITLGTWLHRCALRTSLPWILLVLCIAYGAQSLSAVAFDAQLSAFFGALAMTPAALAIERSRWGPPSLVTYLPAFWMLVPGAAGLIGITEIVGTDSTLGPADFLAMLSTVVEISLGVLIGAAAFHATVEGVPEVARNLPDAHRVERWWQRHRR
jgi:uncharacterized membrane protein YjjP (DUF1212 family)